VSAVPRSVIMGLDTLESRVSLVGAAIALLLAGLFVPHLIHDTWVSDTLTPVKGHCSAPYRLVSGVCRYRHLTHPSYWVPQFLLILIAALVIAGSALWRKRVGVAFAGLFLGLALGTIGVPFLILGGWLVIRALRLQRTGDPTFFGSSRKSRELAAERRATRGAPRERGAARERRSRDAAGPTVRQTPTASKRYTPKKRSTRR
jgi:hypothetical protein